MVNFDIIPFLGNPIAKTKSTYNLSEEEYVFFKAQKFNTNNDGTKLTEQSHLLYKPQISKFKDYLIAVAKDYSENVLGINNEIVLTHSWLTKNSKGNFHNRHNHPNILFSMVYYIHCQSGELTFNTDKSMIQKIFNFDYQIKKHNIFNSKEWCLGVLTNDIVIFPGDLIHGTTPNELDEDRIALGLNFFAKGKFGINDVYGKIEL